MLDPLVFTAVLPLFGAGGVVLLSFVFRRLGINRGYIKGFLAALAIGIIVATFSLTCESGEGIGIVLPSTPSPRPGEAAVEVRWDATLWPLGWSLAVVAGALLLGAPRGQTSSFGLVAACLSLFAVAFAALWSASPFTTIVCWALYDLGFVLVRVAAGGKREEAVRSLSLGTAAGLLLWAGVLVAEGGIGSVQWAHMPPGGRKMTYWILAGMVRLGVYPLHGMSPDSVRSRTPLLGALYLRPILGWGLLIRLALVSNQPLPVDTWMVGLPLMTLASGGFLAWTAREPEEARPWISLGWNGTLILATALIALAGAAVDGGSVASMMTLGAVGWMLATTTLFLGGGLRLRQILRWETVTWGAASLIGALALIGVPGTIGFVTESSVVSSLGRGGHWGWASAYVIGRIFLVAAVVRWLFSTPDLVEQAGNGRWGRIAHGVGLVGLAASLGAVGIWPEALRACGRTMSAPSLKSLLQAPGLSGWVLWGGTLILGGTLAWVDANLRPRVSLWLDAAHDAVRFDWGYELLTGALEQGFVLLRVVDNVLSGRGALLWSCIVLLVVVLILGG